MLPRVEKGTDIDAFDDKDWSSSPLHTLITPETQESINTLLGIMKESQPQMTESQLTSILRARAQSANSLLDKTFVEACIDKAAKGKN